MVHPLISQLRFARSEFRRSLDGVTDEEARRRFMPMNCISWMVGHMASQEQSYWCDFAQGKIVAPRVSELTAHGKIASTPSLDDMWADWTTITEQADVFLDGLTSDHLSEFFTLNGKPAREDIGTMLQRTIYHYWFHNGEAQGVRQLLGHTDLPQFVGKFSEDALYRREG
ncbi:MAG: DUF664 domain-containing protein [Nitrolancea sp.]